MSEKKGRMGEHRVTSGVKIAREASRVPLLNASSARSLEGVGAGVLGGEATYGLAEGGIEHERRARTDGEAHAIGCESTRLRERGEHRPFDCPTIVCVGTSRP
jgi:hypothetical protein